VIDTTQAITLSPEVCALIAAVRSSAGEERARILRAGAEAVPEEMLVSMLREDADDVVRNAALEMLKRRGRRAFTTAVRLLADDDADVVLSAILLLDHIGDPRAWTHLRTLLGHENLNVVQAVVTTAGRLGGCRTAADLLPMLKRPLWVRFAAIDALGQLRSRVAVAPLGRLLKHRDLQQGAAEALARIGGTAAARALARYWLRHQAELDAALWLELLVQALAGAERPPVDTGLRAAVSARLDSDTPAVRSAAAAAILALGPGGDDGRALDVLLAAPQPPSVPLCLVRRVDLAEWLIDAPPPARDWAFELYCSGAVSMPRIDRAFADAPPSDPALAAAVAERVRDAGLLVSGWLRADDGCRDSLERVLRRRRRAVAQWLADASDVQPADRVLLLDLSGAAPHVIRHAVAALDSDARSAVIRRLRNRAVIGWLPWGDWLAADPPRYRELLAAALMRTRSRALLPLLRSALAAAPSAALANAAGVLRDRGSVRALVAALASADPILRVHLYDALAAIGGTVARATLYAAAFDGEADARLAGRALARHAGDDESLLRDLAAHSDWLVRLEAADALARVAGPEISRTLRVLAADRITAVAQKACAALDARGSAA
jgi:HEAT repeat protein